MVTISHIEAIALIKSLSSQLDRKDKLSVNSNRLESYAEDGEYFSIAVTEVHPAEAENMRLRDELRSLSESTAELFKQLRESKH